MTIVKIEEDKHFLIAQRQPGRFGCMGGVDLIYTESENKRDKRKQEEVNRQQYHLATKIPRNHSENLYEIDSDTEEEYDDLTSISLYQQ